MLDYCTMFRRPRDRKAAEPKTGDEGTLIDSRYSMWLLAARSPQSTFSDLICRPMGLRSGRLYRPSPAGSRPQAFLYRARNFGRIANL